MSESGGEADAPVRWLARISRGSRSARFAVTASALLHAALLLAISNRSPVWTRMSDGEAPLDLDIVEVTSRAREALGTPASPPTPAPKRMAPRPEARPGGTRRLPAATPRSAEPPARIESTSQISRAALPEAEGVATPAWMRTRPPDETVAAAAVPRADGDAVAAHRTEPARLSWDTLSLAARDRLAGPMPAAGAPAREPRISVDRLRVERERDDAAVANVRAGRVDPFLHDYVRDARVRFEAGARRIADQLPLDAQKTAESWVHGYAARVGEVNARAAAARNGTPPDSEGPEKDSFERLTGRRPDVLDAYGEAAHAAEAGSIERHVTICLRVAPGRDTTVSVKHESRDPALDQLAREAFSRAAAARPVPSDAHAATACYDLRIRAFRMPPLPVLSCGIDKDGPTCAWPFKKITSVTVHLESVDYPEEDGAGSLLRRAR